MQTTTEKRKYPSIPLNVLAFMAWRNLITKKLRSSLTILGVVIGVGSIFFLLSLGLGLQNLVTEEVVGNQSIQSIDVTSPNSRIVKLNNGSVNKIKDLPRVETVGVSYSFAGSITLNGSEVDAVAYGIDHAYQKLLNLQAIKGDLLPAEGVDNAIINTALLASMGIENPDQVIGKNIDIRIPIPNTTSGEPTELVKTFKLAGVIDSGSGGEVFIPSILLDQAGAEQYTQVKIMTDNDSDVSGLRKQVESMGFSTTSPIDTIDEINQIFKYFNVVLVGFGAIGMIIAVLGMFNTLTISLLERTKEIGLMLTLGGRPKDMRLLFVIEAVLLSIIGAMTGIVLATMGGWIANLSMNQFARSRGVHDNFDIFSTPLWLVALLTLFMVVIGLLVVLVPARRAEKINLVDALRRE